MSGDDWVAAADVIAGQVTNEDLAVGRVYPPMEKMPEVILKIAVDFVERAWREGRATTAHPEPSDKRQFIESLQYNLKYKDEAEANFKWPPQDSKPQNFV